MTQGQLFEPESSGSKLDKAISGLPCRVLIDVSGFARELDYVLPDQLIGKVSVGSIVRVRLKNRVVKGWVTSIDLRESEVSLRNLKPVLSVYSVGPDSEIVELARWVGHWFLGPMRTVLSSASPNRIIKSHPKLRTRATASVSTPTLKRAISNGSSVQFVSKPQENGVELVLELARAGQTLVIVPSPQEVDRLVGFLRRQGVAASNYSTDWAGGLRGDTVVGTAKAALASLVTPQAFVVLDSQSSHYKMRRSPHWDVTTILQKRAEGRGVPLLLVSPFPSVEASTRVESVVRLPERAQTQERATVEIVDVSVREELGSKLLSSKLVERLRSCGNGLVVVNRKSASNLLYCGACGVAISSEDGTSLMIEVDGCLVVPGGVETRPCVCQNCGSTKLKRYRLGVKGLADQLEALVGESAVTIDAGTDKIPTSNYYVGTSAAISRNLPVSVIAFADIDSDLAIPGNRTRYETAHQVIGAKRALANGGALIVQTRQPENEFIHWIISEDPTLMLAKETATRRAFGLAPYGYTAQISGKSADQAADALKAAKIEVLGPKDGAYLVKAKEASHIISEISELRSKLGARLKVVVNSFDV